MKKIYKYTLDGGTFQVLHIPFGRFLSVQNQNGNIVFWQQEDSSVKHKRNFAIVGTGISHDFLGVYLGTVQIKELVWHVFELFGVDVPTT